MEKTISVEERIKRAEEIYNRRRESEEGTSIYKPSIEKKRKKSVLKRMKNQIIVCVIVYSIGYFVINGDYEFSKNIRNKIDEIMENKVNFEQIGTEIGRWWEATVNTFNRNK